MTDLRDKILDLMKTPTARDNQSLVGASNISNPCTRCLADDMLGSRKSDSSFAWMGAWTGTAMHNRMEDEVTQHRADQGWLSEQRLVLGEIPGYGTVKSTTDLYLPDNGGTVGDFKSTTRDKLAHIRRALEEPEDPLEITKVTEARVKVSGYLNQVMLYGRGVRDTLHLPIAKVALIFLCRDGVSDKDVWVFETDYDENRANKVWDRAVRLWEWLQAGNDPRQLNSHPQCYYCNNVRNWSE